LEGRQKIKCKHVKREATADLFQYSRVLFRQKQIKENARGSNLPHTTTYLTHRSNMTR